MSLLLAIASLATASAPPVALQARRAVSPAAVTVLHNFADCVVSRREKRVREVLAMDFRTDAYQKAMHSFAISEKSCLFSGQLRSGGVLMAGAFAEVLLKRDLRDTTLLEAMLLEGERPTSRGPAEEMAQCIVGSDPGRVQAMLATAPASDEERNSINALEAAAANCLPKKETARMNAPGMRSLVALAAYRLTRKGAVGTLKS